MPAGRPSDYKPETVTLCVRGFLTRRRESISMYCVAAVANELADLCRWMPGEVIWVD